ncbi:hypothetical protein [Saccharothrix lopnurensis]
MLTYPAAITLFNRTPIRLGDMIRAERAREAVDLLAALADDLRAAGKRAARLACAILDGTLVPIHRVIN